MRGSRLNRKVAPLFTPNFSRGIHLGAAPECLVAPGGRLRPVLVQPRVFSLPYKARSGAGARTLFIQTETTPNVDVEYEDPTSTTRS